MSYISVSNISRVLIENVDGKIVPVRPSYLRLMSTPSEEPEIEIHGYIEREEETQNIIKTFAGLEYTKIIFNPPATIVLWKDGSKTVVKCDDKDKFDREKGVALCFMKKALGNKSRQINDILKEVM